MQDNRKTKLLLRILGAALLVLGIGSFFFPTFQLMLDGGVSTTMPLVNPARAWWSLPLVCSLLCMVSGLGMLRLRPWSRVLTMLTAVLSLLTSPLWAQQVAVGMRAVTKPPDMEIFIVTIGITAFLTLVLAYTLLHVYPDSTPDN